MRDVSGADASPQLGNDVWELCLRFLRDIALERPIGPQTVAEMRSLVYGGAGEPRPAPVAGMPLHEVLSDVEHHILPAMFSSWHPRSFSYFTPPPMLASILGDLIAAWTDQSVDTWQSGPGAALIEHEVVRWLCDLVGYGPGAGGVLTSGGVTANLTALAVMRDIRLGATGIDGRRALERARVYVSDQAHFSIGRSLDLLGLPPGTLVVLPSDERFRLDPGLVRDAIAHDRREGSVPLAIAAVAGSTNTGSIDPIDELSDVAERYGLWLHVDAAYGGAARCAAALSDRLGSIERADSITLDPHKWMFQAIDIGASLVREGGELLSTFDRDPEYYESNQPGSQPIEWFRHGIEGTRRFRSLKLWMSWRQVGTRGFGEMVERTVELAGELAAMIDRSADLELAIEPELSVVCFRHLPMECADDELDRHQIALQRALEVAGVAWVSTTRLRGATWLRAGIMHPHTSSADLEILLAEVRRCGLAARDG